MVAIWVFENSQIIQIWRFLNGMQEIK